MAKIYDVNKRFRDDHVYKASVAYDVEQREGETELHYYRRLAKVADQRLLRLEAYRHDKMFEGLEKMAYGRAMEDLKIFGGGSRFNTAPPEDRRLFREKIMSMRYFLQSPTSTKQGIIETYKKRADSINQEFFGGEPVLKWQDLENYFGKGKADKDERNMPGSRTALYAIGVIKLTQKQGEVPQLIENVMKKTSVKVSGPLTDAAIQMLKNQNIPDFARMSDKQKAAVLKKLEATR